MRKLLPQSSKNPQGFTLIELLITISILAILAVMGMVIFSNVQKNARDARRKADIDAIATAMETNYSDTTGQYSNMATTFFSSGVYPQDPSNGNLSCAGSNICRYCAGATSMAAGPNGATGTGCPTNGAAIADSMPAAGTSFRVCASLESGTPNYYCRQNQR